jgi:hypothetical protein
MADVPDRVEAASPYGDAIEQGPTLCFMTDVPDRTSSASPYGDAIDLGPTLCFMADVPDRTEAASPYGDAIELGPTLCFMTDVPDRTEAASPYGDVIELGPTLCFMTDVPDRTEAASPYGDAREVGPTLCFMKDASDRAPASSPSFGTPSLLSKTDRRGLTLPIIFFIADITDLVVEVVAASDGTFPSLAYVTDRGPTLFFKADIPEVVENSSGSRTLVMLTGPLASTELASPSLRSTQDPLVPKFVSFLFVFQAEAPPVTCCRE